MNVDAPTVTERRLLLLSASRVRATRKKRKNPNGPKALEIAVALDYDVAVHAKGVNDPRTIAKWSRRITPVESFRLFSRIDVAASGRRKVSRVAPTRERSCAKAIVRPRFVDIVG